MLEYAEYKDVIEVLGRSNQDDVYQDLMKKEVNVLDTVNAVVKTYKDKNITSKEFINRTLMENISRFWLDMNLMIKELFDIADVKEIPRILSKKDRIIYLGFICIFLAIIFFFVEISK